MNLGGVIHLNKTGICLLGAGMLILFLYMLSNNAKDNHSIQKVNLKTLLKVAIKAAENGGKEVVVNKDNPIVKSKGLTKEGMDESVTPADYLSHCSILKTLKHTYPTINVVSEEQVNCDIKKIVDLDEKNIDVPENIKDYLEDIKDITVWIDPLDATHEYTEKLFQYVTTMVCVAVKGQPVIGVIHKPFEKLGLQTFWAWTNVTKSINLKTEESKSDKLRIIISRSHSGEIRKKLIQNIENFNLDDLIIAAGAGYKALEVANGKADAYLHVTAIKKWDICAGNAILNAMGGKMTTKSNQLIDYGDSANVLNEQGLVATLKNHNKFINKL